MAEMSQHLSQKELESYLWGAATLLRGLNGFHINEYGSCEVV